MTATRTSFDPRLFAFLRELRRNNRREWFQDNKQRYEEIVRHPALLFISDFGVPLQSISRHFSADPRPVGGSLFRIHRDVRFSSDKSPYKTSVGIQFRHRQSRNVHSPGFYLHLEPDECFVGLGIWRPDAAALTKIRTYIAKRSEEWIRVIDEPGFSNRFELAGERLKRAPQGFDPDHPLIQDLRRKDFIATAPLSEGEVTAAGFLDIYTERCREGKAFVRLLCDAVGVPF